jgi:hypothetical protein
MKLAQNEKLAIRRTLAVLAPDHPARVAAERDADPVVLTQLVEREDLVEALQDIWFTAYRRSLGL